MWATTLFALFAKKAWKLPKGVLPLCFAVAAPSVWATPGKVEVWFLMEPTAKTGHIPELQSPLKNKFESSRLWVTNTMDANCTPMGDGCFNPQIGFIPKEGSKKDFPDDENVKEGSAEWKAQVFSSDDVSMVDCKKDYYFDLYCGKELKSSTAPQGGLEVWIDNSSSLKGIDSMATGDYCFRRTFAEKLKLQCEGKVSFSVYNNSLKPVSDLSATCINQGGNDPARLMRWIRESNAKELIIITDVAEHSEKFEVFLDSIGGVMRGMGTSGLYAKDLDSLVSGLSKNCL